MVLVKTRGIFVVTVDSSDSECVACSQEDVRHGGTCTAPTLRGHIERRSHFRSGNRSVPFWLPVRNGLLYNLM